MRRPPVRILPIVLVIVAACGGGGATSTSAATTPTTEGATTSEAATTTTETPPSGPVAGEVTTIAAIDAATGGVTVGPDGNLYVADIGASPGFGGTTVYRVTLDGDVEVFAEDPLLSGASGNTVDPEGFLFQSAYTGRRVNRIAADGTVTPFADNPLIAGPVGVVSDGAGGIYFVDCNGRTVNHVAADGTMTPVASSPIFACANGLAIDEDGNLYLALLGNGRIYRIAPGESPEELANIPGGGNAHIAYANGYLFITSNGGHQIWALSPEGALALFAGTGEPGIADGPAGQATFTRPNGIALGPDGAIYINQSTDPSGNYSTLVRRIEILDWGT